MRMKKLLAVVLALTVALTMGIATTGVAFAAPTDTTLKVKDPVDGHTYTAYQLFVGDLAKDGKTLSNVKWGSNVASSITYGETTIAPVAGEAVPQGVIEYLAGLENDSQATANTIDAWVTGTGTEITAEGITVKTGYYVVKDAYTDPSADQTTTISTVICQVVGPTEVTPKAGTTEHKKEVADVNDTTDVALDLSNLQGIENWSDSADYDIGDAVPFKLTTTIASDFAKYKKYYLAVKDDLEDGLALNEDSIVVYVDGVAATEGEAAGQYTLTKSEAGFQVIFNDLTSNENAGAGKNVVVYYTATLTANAVAGNPGNWNESYATFSNNPNGDQNGTGNTPKDTSVVFTYKTVIDKVNEKKEPLEGAEFTLVKKIKDADDKVIDVVIAESGTEFTFNGLDDGTYVLTETKTPDGYNTIDPITFKVTATHKNVPGTGEVQELTVTDKDGNALPEGIAFTATAATGTIASTIVNNSGGVLPSTGGIGTTIFYILGALLVIVCGVVLIARRRTAAK